MTNVTRRFVIPCDIERVWSAVTSLTDYRWRSDLGKIEITEPGRCFTEYTKDGFPTHFTITAFEPGRRYEFDMDNANMKGHWTGIFRAEQNQTYLELTETVTPKKFYMRPFVRLYLQKQQATYCKDLQRKCQL